MEVDLLPRKVLPHVVHDAARVAAVLVPRPPQPAVDGHVVVVARVAARVDEVGKVLEPLLVDGRLVRAAGLADDDRELGALALRLCFFVVSFFLWVFGSGWGVER